MPNKLINKTKINQLKFGAVLSYLQMGLNIVIGLIYTPYMIRMLGQNEYGLYNSVSSSIMMLHILNLGFNAGYIRYFARYKTSGNKDDISKLNGLFMIIFLLIGSFSFILGLLFSFNLNYVFKNGLSDSEYETAKILAILTTLNISISFPASVFQTIISAHEKFIVLKLIGMVRSVLTPLIMIPILYFGYKSITMVFVTLLLALVADISYFLYCKYILKIHFHFHGLDKNIISGLFAYTFFIALNSIVDQINLNIDKLLLGRFKGTIAVAVYSVGFQMYMFYQIMSSSISSVFTPRVHNIMNQFKDDKEKCFSELNSIFVKIGRIQFLILALVASGVVIFGKAFLGFWVGNGYEDSYYVALLLIIPASIALIQNLGIEIQRAENRHQFRSCAYIIMALINLIMSIYLCQIYGAIGSAIGTAVSLILANGLIMNIYYQLKCGIDVIVFWKNIILMSFGLIFPIVISYLLPNYFNYYSKTGFVGGVFIYTLVYCISMWFVSMNQYEKSLIPVFKRICKTREG